MALVQKAFSDIITFSRSSNATRIGPTGLVEYAPHNLQVRSQEFENAIWTKAGATITANATAAPDDTVTAEKLVEDSSNGDHQTYQIGLTVVAQSYTASVYAKAAERTNIWLALFNGTNNGGVYFNLANGTAGGLGTDITAASITPAGNGWYRCSITRTMVASANAGINIQLADAIPFISYVGNGSSGVYIWGAQLAVGPYALDYTPTTSAAVYGPRFDFDPVTLAARGLLVEEQRTNLVTYSEDFSNAAWSKTNSTVTANAAASPSGEVSADKLVENAGSGSKFVRRAISLSGASTFSVYAKAVERSQLFLQFESSAGGSGSGALFDLSTATVGTPYVYGSGYSNASATITNIGNSWYRCVFTATVPTTTVNCDIYLSSSGSASYTGNGTSGLLLWGAQLEAGSFATSYLPTLASTVTRSADVASVDTLSPWYNASAGTFYAEGSTNGFNAGRLLSLSDSPGSASTVQSINFETSGATRVYQVSGSLNFDFAPGAYTPQAIVKIAGRFNASNYAGVQNGGAVSTSSDSTTPPTMVYMALGALTSNSFYLNGHLRRVAYYPRALTNAEIQALTS